MEEDRIIETEGQGMQEPSAKATLPPLRKAVNHTFFWMLIYNILVSVIAAIIMLFKVESGIESVASTLIGVALVFLFTRKKWPVRPFEHHKKMNGKDFFFFLCLVGIFQIMTLGIMTAVKAAGVSGTSIEINEKAIPFLIYAGFTGPFCEEMIYRGFAVGNLRKYGKIMAIVVSAFAFGLMHMNATQFVVGLLAGLLLGYIFTEYSIWWAFIFHMINNFGFTVLPEMLFPNVPSGDLNMYIYILLGVLSVIGIFILVKRWPKIRAYFTDPENKAPKGSFGKIVTSPWFIIYVLIYAAIISLFMIFPESLDAIVSGTVPGLN